MILVLCHSGYGITLWYPTYINELTTAKDAAIFEEMCNTTVTEDDLGKFCGCSNTMFENFILRDTKFQNFKINDVTFYNASFTSVNFDNILFNQTEFIECQFIECNFTKTLFNATDFNGVEFRSIRIGSSSMCPLNSSDVEVENFVTSLNVNISGRSVGNRTFDTASFNKVLSLGSSHGCDLKVDREEVSCTPPSSRLYRDSFFVSASAFPGNIASAFAVYFFRRNYWLGE